MKGGDVIMNKRAQRGRSLLIRWRWYSLWASHKRGCDLDILSFGWVDKQRDMHASTFSSSANGDRKVSEKDNTWT